jgi:Protein of unknown function (DUF4231)
MSADVAMERLDDQIAWYDNRSNRNQQFYKIMKITVIATAALIPLLSGLQVPYFVPMGVPPWVLGILGALIAIVEGIQLIFQLIQRARPRGGWRQQTFRAALRC